LIFNELLHPSTNINKNFDMTESQHSTASPSEQKQQANNNSNNNHFICGVVEGFYGKPWTFHQRKDLFKQLRQLRLNSFMYAPKGDAKHRSKWRQLYSDSEAHELKILIDEAAANGIDFYYSLAPGLDMVYSDPEDTKQLCRKFDQLRSLGCKSFALLFDDIDPCLSHEKDRAIFKDNYASAQVSVTNLIYDYLDRPNFLFCPTEYCESRAVPNVLESLYLNTIGAELHSGIDIMWSGSRVISRCITEESIKELNSVIRRRVLIWENLHANDYDKKRVFLGPYSGRSTKIIPQLRGVLTNPNCEYEANYVAIHTLAQWKQCSKDSNPHNMCNQKSDRCQTSSDLSQEVLASSGGPSPSDCLDGNRSNLYDESVYDPDQALTRALRDWLPHVLSSKSLPAGININCERDDNLASDQINKDEQAIANAKATGPQDATNDFESMKAVDDVDQEIKDEEMPDEREASPANSTLSRSDMDTSSSPPQPVNNVDSNSCDSCEMQVVSPETGPRLDVKDPQLPCLTCSTATPMQRHQAAQDCQAELNLDNLALLVDFFYLPFEHGVRGCAFLNDIKWLIEHSVVFLDQEDGNKSQENEKEDKSKLVELWLEKAEILNNSCIFINKLVNTLVVSMHMLHLIKLCPIRRNLNHH
jgi:protein O-GlcNAcase/histone acetyltransferase